MNACSSCIHSWPDWKFRACPNRDFYREEKGYYDEIAGDFTVNKILKSEEEIQKIIEDIRDRTKQEWEDRLKELEEALIEYKGEIDERKKV